MPGTSRPRHFLQWNATSVLIVLAVWTGLVAMSVANSAVLSQQYGRDFDLGLSVATRAIDWYSCAVFTPLFIWLARRYPIERATWRKDVAIWLGVTVAVTPLRFLLHHGAIRTLFPQLDQPTISERIIGGTIMEVVAFWLMAAVILCVEYYDRWRERDVQAHALGQHLAEARLEALTAQLQPHFLFNTLQGISTLLYRDASRADDMLRRLSELLRRTLQSAARPEVTLDEELTTLEHYIAIQRIRFDGRLTVNVDPDGMGGALVPNFILQPLVENAIEHGIARSAGAGTIDVSASVRQGRLVLEVRDDGTPARTSGTGSPNSPQPASTNSAQPVSPNGIGLANTRARLHALFGDAATLEVTERDGGGFTVTIAVPFRRAETQRT